MFIVFEGLDGCGKSTQCKLLKDRLEKEGKKVWLTAEPTDSRIGKLIRDIQGRKESIPTSTLKYLYIADRILHVNEIMEHLERGEVVICDRYWYSSVAYQDCVEYSGESAFNLNDMEDFPFPDIVFYIDTCVNECLTRIGKRDVEEIFETRNYLLNVQEKYDEILEYSGMIRINGNTGIEEIGNTIYEYCNNKQM